MKTIWNLSVIYNGLTDPAYEADVRAFEEAVKETENVLNCNSLGAFNIGIRVP